jgi:RNA polymerase sigma factor for flagellar operon FliA
MWREYAAGGREDKRLRDILTTHYFPLTLKVAGKQARAYPAHVDRDALESWAAAGLMRAVANYDPIPRPDKAGVIPKRPVTFETYAVASMRSVIMDGVRKLDWAPRSLRSKQRALDECRTRLTQELSRKPSDSEVADSIGWAEAEVRRIDAEVAVSWHSYIEEQPGIHEEHHEAPPKPESELTVSLRAALAGEYTRMSAPAQVVLALHYFEEQTLAEVAEALGVSESYVNSVHSAAVLQIYESLMGVMGVAVIKQVES